MSYHSKAALALSFPRTELVWRSSKMLCLARLFLDAPDLRTMIPDIPGTSAFFRLGPPEVLYNETHDRRPQTWNLTTPTSLEPRLH